MHAAHGLRTPPSRRSEPKRAILPANSHALTLR
nr:MAG TPA: hypothetical protein [Caudoviricetes sp.]